MKTGVSVTIHINGKSTSIDEGITLGNLLAKLTLPKQSVAVELNRQIIAKQSWSEVCLREGDQLEIVAAVGGGSGLADCAQQGVVWQ